VVGEGGELGGVASQPLHLVHGEDDPAVRGVGLDLSRQGEGGRVRQPPWSPRSRAVCRETGGDCI